MNSPIADITWGVGILPGSENKIVKIKRATHPHPKVIHTSIRGRPRHSFHGRNVVWSRKKATRVSLARQNKKGSP